MRRYWFVAAFLLALVFAARADDLWSTAIAERPSDGWKIIHRFIDELGDPSDKQRYPVAATFRWKYDGPNGLPAKSQTEAIYRLEDLLDASVEKRSEGRLALISTGDNLRSWTYYVKNEAVFRKALAAATAAVNLQVQVSFESDPSWAQLEKLRKGVRR
jgi:hypothetical protein